MPKRVYWGVAHVHTGFSFDSGMFGITLSPDDLFKVARGGEVVMDNGQRFKQDRPLDWVSITDHAEYLGIADQIRAGSPWKGTISRDIFIQRCRCSSSGNSSITASSVR